MQELSIIVSRGHTLKGVGQASGGRAGERRGEFRFQIRRGCLATKQGVSGNQPAAGQFVLGWPAADRFKIMVLRVWKLFLS